MASHIRAKADNGVNMVLTLVHDLDSAGVICSLIFVVDIKHTKDMLTPTVKVQARPANNIIKGLVS
jgi:hypothetical protein